MVKFEKKSISFIVFALPRERHFGVDFPTTIASKISFAGQYTDFVDFNQHKQFHPAHS